MTNLEIWKIWEGRVVDGKFRLRQLLGGSDHSAVFLIERQSPEKAAIKLIPADSEQADRHLAHWSAAARLSHPHLLRLYESGRCEINGAPHLYAVMEFADEDLSQVLPQRPLTPSEAGDLLPPVLDALSHLHARKLVHTRIKPSNVLAVGNQLKLSTDQLIAEGEVGTERERRDIYDAPERAAGVISPEADIWSLGLTLFATLTQSAPFYDQVSQLDPEALKKIPEPYRGIVRECLHLDPKRRCSISQIQSRLHPSARSVPAEPEPAPARPARKRPLPIATIAVVVALLIWFIVSYSRSRSTSPHSSGNQASQPAPHEPPAPSGAVPPNPSAQSANNSASAGAKVVKRVVPAVPQSARNTVSGKIKVNVEVNVDQSGKVESAKLTRSGPSHYFANLALRAAREWEFSPAEVNGHGAASAWMLHFSFSRAGADVSPERLKR